MKTACATSSSMYTRFGCDFGSIPFILQTAKLQINNLSFVYVPLVSGTLAVDSQLRPQNWIIPSFIKPLFILQCHRSCFVLKMLKCWFIQNCWISKWSRVSCSNGSRSRFAIVIWPSERWKWKTSTPIGQMALLIMLSYLMWVLFKSMFLFVSGQRVKTTVSLSIGPT